VFWKVEGLVSMASGTTMRGTVIANNAGIILNTGVTLEGRALSTAGAITVDGVLAYTPIGCGSPTLSGPTAPELASAECYAIFSGDGAVSNTGISKIMGDVGSNVGSAAGFDPLKVSGTIHPIPDGSTAQCAADLQIAYNYLNMLPYDIELLYPAQFGRNLVLTPHTYIMKAAAELTDTLYLNALGNVNAVFVFQIEGALTTSVYSKVLLINGAQAKNVYWKIEGAVGINNYSVFCGTIICNNGALGAINTGVTLNGRALTTSGALTTAAITSTMPATGCTLTGITPADAGKTNETVSIYPNPFKTSIHILINGSAQLNKAELRLYSIAGAVVMNTSITKHATTLETNSLPSGIYFYKIIDNNKIIQSGKLVSR
jgi:hypothetical protein